MSRAKRWRGLAWLPIVAIGLATARGAEYRVTPETLPQANASAKPGDVFLLAEGKYGTIPICPARSGEPGKPIVYKAVAGEKPLFVDLWEPIDLRGRSHVTIEGISVNDVGRFVSAEASSGITIARCDFDDSWGWESCSFKNMGDNLRFTNNVLKGGTDLLSVEGGNGHLIEGNTFEGAGHACLVLMGVQRSAVRGNKLTNPKQRLMELFSTRKRYYPDPQRKSLHILIEDNVFGETALCGLDCAGNRSIVRRNTFWKCGTAVAFSVRQGWDAPDALHCRENRFYQNTISGCGTGALIARDAPAQDIGELAFANNIVFRNACSLPGLPGTAQVVFRGVEPSAARFFGNDLFGGKAGEAVLADATSKKGFALKDFEAAQAQSAAGNIEAAPQFANADGGDFRLKPGSPCIDAGKPLTKAKVAGKGTEILVDDALFFCDGFGIVEPDAIRVGAERAKIAKVDYEKNRIVLDKSISWDAGAAVSLEFRGNAPDVGAQEFDAGGAK